MRFEVVGVSGTAGDEPEGAEALDGENDGVRWRCSVNGTMRNEEQGTGLRLVPKPMRRAGHRAVIREGSTGRVVEAVANGLRLERVWAVADVNPAEQLDIKPEEDGKPKVELAFYRKYTEAMLRRYLRMSIQTGRVPSLLGRELFRGNVTSYKMHGFEDGVIFCFKAAYVIVRLTNHGCITV